MADTFDRSKPHLISGDQFSVLYTRNLGVFYNSLLNPYTAHNQLDWEHRQRIYLQSALFALEAFSKANALTTTLVPMGRKSVVLTQVHPGSIASDTMYGLLYALHALQDDTRYPDAPFQLQAVAAVRELIDVRRADLQCLLKIYCNAVQDDQTKLLKPNLDLASARDGVVRDRSFYDAVILWKTLDLARRLDISGIRQQELDDIRQHIIGLYWDRTEGHFRDDLSPDKAPFANYSSDWLIALPTGFLDLPQKTSRQYVARCVDFIRQHGIDKPFPIRYQVNNQHLHAPWAVRTFVPNYGGNAIWSYWGAQYITLLAELAAVDPRKSKDNGYREDARYYCAIYRQKIERYQGFPETFNTKGDFLQNAVYKSIRQTGWVVQLEEAEWRLSLLDGDAESALQTKHNPTLQPHRGG